MEGKIDDTHISSNGQSSKMSPIRHNLHVGGRLRQMHDILHIMPHMGPGVGKAVSALSVNAARTNSKYRHSVLLLEKPLDFNYIEQCRENGVDVYWSQDEKALFNRIADSDIVQLEWWHHPLVLGILGDLSKIPLRLTVWSHISGCNYPVISPNFISLAEHFFFTTPYAYENPLWNEADRQRVLSNSTVAFGSGGCENVADARPRFHSGFNIGFIGTLDFRKLHPRFVDYCAEVNIPDATFILVGNPGNRSAILQQAREKKMDSRFRFVGYTHDVKSELERFDVFGYLLNPEHYGSTDNVLIEAMGACMPIIVLNQCGEKHVIEHMETGIIINNKEEYGRAVKFLYDHPEERKRLGENAKNAAAEKFSPLSTMQKLHREYDRVISKNKKKYPFDKVFGTRPYEWFLAGLGSERQIFEFETGHKGANTANLESSMGTLRDILKGTTKSSIPHFYRYFPFDIKLSQWNQMIKR